MSRENVEIVRRLLAAIGERDLHTLRDLTDPQVEWRSFFAIGEGGGMYRGHDAIPQYLRDIEEAFEWLRPEVSDLLDVGNVIIGVGRVRYRGKESGVETESPAGWVFRLHDARIVRFRAFRDPEEALEAVGLRGVAMSRENVEVAQRLIDAANRDDVPSALACLDPDIEWIPQLAAVEGAYHGHEGFEGFMADLREAWERFQLHVELHDLGDRVLVAGTISARGGGSGVETEVPVGGIFDFRGGRIVRWQAFGSGEEAFEAVGLPE